jgi:hypothetical protein
MLILYLYIWLVYVYFGLSAPILPTITADNRESTVVALDGIYLNLPWYIPLYFIVMADERFILRARQFFHFPLSHMGRLSCSVFARTFQNKCTLRNSGASQKCCSVLQIQLDQLVSCVGRGRHVPAD